jgi:glycerophosphoryl diester phosphodiesterase
MSGERRWRAGGDGPPLVIGHRGASAHVLENTMAAFERARADGADGVELDVRLTADGSPAVVHDADLRRLATRRDRIARLTDAALGEIVLEGGHRTPLLDQVLGDLPALLVNVEIKMPGARRVVAAARAVAEAIARTRAADRVVVSSFDPRVVAVSRAIAPHVRTGLLFHARQTPPMRGAWLAPVLRPFAVHPERVLVDAARVARWRAAGYAINVWTVDGQAEVTRLAALGVDALITNDPAATRAILASR